MPTGYTCKIEDGTIKTSKEFLKYCLNAFGVMIHNRDNAPTMEEPDFDAAYAYDIEYHEAQIKDINKKIIHLKSTSFDEYALTKKAQYEKKLNESIQHLEDEKELVQKYEKILKGVENWDCDDELKGIKKFAIEQINISLPNLKYAQEDIDYYKKKLSNPVAQEDYDDEMISLCDNIVYHEKQINLYKTKISDCKRFYKKFINDIEYVE